MRLGAAVGATRDVIDVAVFRVEKTRDYTVMSNCHLGDKRLTLKAKGLMSFMLSLPDDWDYTIKGMAALHADGIDSIRTALVELGRYGYMERRRNRDAHGRLRDTEYVIFETPQDGGQGSLPRLDFPILEKPILEKPTQENPTQINTKERSTKESNTNPTKDEGGFALGRYGNVRLSDADMASLSLEFGEGLSARIERLSEYMETSGKAYRNHAATIRSWAKRDAERNAQPARKSVDYGYEEGDVL